MGEEGQAPRKNGEVWKWITAVLASAIVGGALVRVEYVFGVLPEISRTVETYRLTVEGERTDTVRRAAAERAENASNIADLRSRLDRAIDMISNGTAERAQLLAELRAIRERIDRLERRPGAGGG